MGEKAFTEGFTPLEEGDYLVRMNRCELVPCNNGRMVKASFQVVNGDAKNRLIFDSFLVEHSNPKAEKIGKDRLSNYLKAIGVEDGLDGIGHDYARLEEFLESPFVAAVKIEDGYEYTDKKSGEKRTAKASNKVKTFKKRG